MNVAFTTILNNKYISGFLLTLNSLLRSSPNFNCDIVIFEWGDLSDDNKNLIKGFYKNIIFKSVNTELYKNHSFDETFRIWTYNCNYRFDIFTLAEYDKIIFFDSDIIFQIDVDELINLDVDFGACFAEKDIVIQLNDNGFETGLLIISKKYLNSNVRDDLILIAESEAPTTKHVKGNKWISDEPILNFYFKDKVTIIPRKYNLTVSKVDNLDFKVKNNYHYTGENKPWLSNEIEKQFSEHAIEKIKEYHGPVLYNLVLYKLVNLVKCEIEDIFLNKKINIYDYC
jgi:lipopolysaccharide biosynthesis glycosyltransferase